MEESQIALGAMRLAGSSAAVLTASNLVDGSLLSQCASTQLSELDVFGAKILAVDASPLQNYTLNTDSGTWSDLSICNVTVTYTHPGRNDNIHVDVWLPLEDWNGRFQGAGGGGWRMGPSIDTLASAASQGFSVARTDGGHDLSTRSDPEYWALDSPGNVNLNLLQDFASLALYDLANIGKQITGSFYGTPAKNSYWNGCSTGGRQGLMLAQRYPDAFDGILAIAPAINWAHFLLAEYWPQQVMNRLGYYPPPCVSEAINQAAIEACDDLDGVVDGIISDPRICDFDATKVVGKSINCNGTQVSISEEAAIIANATWSGARDPSGRYNWYGLAKGTLFYNASAADGLVGTNCTDSSVASCSGAPFPYSRDWIKYFVYKDPNYPVENMTDAEFFATMHKSVQEYESIISASDPDLSPFKNRGGKMITWHGLSDQLIFPDGTVEYYEKVRKLDPAAKDFYRFFEAPGVEHCSGGIGPAPSGALSDLIKWVEEEEVPETLLAVNQTGGAGTRRRLCLWPKKQKYIGGNPDQDESFTSNIFLQFGLTSYQPGLTAVAQYGTDATYLPPRPAEGLPPMDHAQATAEKMKQDLGLGDGANVVLECSGAESCVQSGVYVAKPGATIVQAGIGKEIVAFPITTICTQGLVLKGSIRYLPGSYPAAIDLIATGKINAKGLVTHRFKFEQAEEAFELVKAGRSDVFKVMIEGVVE